MSSTRTVSLIGCPFHGGQPLAGVDLGPGAVRDAGIKSTIDTLPVPPDHAPWILRDAGDVPCEKENDYDYSQDHGNAHNSVGVATVNHRLYEMVKKEIPISDFILTIGGDHSIAIGSITALLEAKPDLCIIWIDAHADINTPEGSISKNMHGMPVSFLCRLENTAEVTGFDWLKSLPALNTSRIAYIGLRDVDEAEKVILKKHSITAFTMKEVDRYGINEVIQRAMKAVDPEGTRPIHISLDVDGLDICHAPATGTAVPGGLTLRELRYVCETLYDTGRLKSLDVVEINPLAGKTKEDLRVTVQSAYVAIKACLGYSLS